MKIILSVDAIRYPLTGIGRYASELAQGLGGHPRTTSLRYYSMGQWLHAPPVPVAPPAAEPRPTLSPLGRARAALVANPLAVRLYRRVAPLLNRWRLRGFRDHLFHAPNYFLPPFDGPSVATIHDLSTLLYPQFHPEDRVALINGELPKTLERASHLITDAEAIRREIIARFDWPAERISAIPLGVDDSFHPRGRQALSGPLQSYGLAPGGYCLCVATIEPRKNIGRLVDAHAKLPPALRQGFPLVLVGEPGWKSQDIHRRIEAAQGRGTVRYLDYVPQTHLPLLYAGARLFALPSHYEGFGLPLLEAMASGVPLVTSTCPTLLELAGEVGLLVDPEDTDGLTQALERGLEDVQWREQARRLGLARAGQHSWQRCVENTLDLYQRLVDTHFKHRGAARW